MMKKGLFLCMIILVVISGCVDKTQTQSEKAGWDQAKYEEYSKYYDNLINEPCINGNINFCTSQSKYQSLVFEIKEKLFNIRSNGSEFERTWFMVFSNLQNGLELVVKADDFSCYPIDINSEPDRVKIDSCGKHQKWLLEARPYFDKSLEYRHKIEEWNPSKTSPTLQAIPITSTIPIITSTSEHKTINNSTGMEFVLITAGEFDMGSPSNETGRLGDEGPVHHVKISEAFYMGKYEVTQKQWRDVMGNNPSYLKGDDLPVEMVSWKDVQEFIKKLNEKEGTNKYRLPTEAEWEYAARAGTTTRYSFGDDESKLSNYAWYKSNSESKTHSVGQKKPNPWGLYDIHGNVWEWVQDAYHNEQYDGAPNDGSSWENGYGFNRVVRTGGYLDPAVDCRSARRVPNDLGNRNYYTGFRLLRSS